MKINSFSVINLALSTIAIVALFYHPESHLLWVGLGLLVLISVVDFVRNREINK